MKKILYLILIFTLLFCFSCNVADGGDILSEHPSESKPEAPESSQPDESNSNIEGSLQPKESKDVSPEESSNKAKETGGSDIGEGYGEVETSTFSTYEAYLEFIGSLKQLPYDFITYDMLKELGTFKSFILSSSEIDTYIYSFVDKNGIEFSVKIKPLPLELDTNCIVTPSNKDNLRTVTQNSQRTTYVYNNISYHYYTSGRLYKITWTFRGELLELGVATDKRLADYPLDGETTFVSQLLSTQTATAAIEAFNQKVEAELAKNIADKQSKG